MNKADLKKIIVSQKEEKQPIEYIERDLTGQDLASQDPFIRIIAGIRRCGKSTLMEHIRQQRKENDYVINFDDNRLTRFTASDFEKLFEAFHELYEPQKTWYFDEIQIIDGWEKFVRRLHNEGHKIFITGSNATMLSMELGSSLTGRYIQTALFPFSFYEYLKLKNIPFHTTSIYSGKETTNIRKAFSDYLIRGGFPEYLITENSNFLKTLYENIVFRDVVVRYNIRNTKAVLEMVHFLVSNISREISYNTLKNILNISNAASVKEYIGYFENSYLLFTLNKFDFSRKKQIANPKKIYVIDTGLANAVSFQFSENFGRQLENLVYIELRRRNKEIFFHRGKFECDFLCMERGKVIEAIQVTRSVDDASVLKREINGLTEAMNMHGLSEGKIITDDEEGELQQNNMVIKIMPAWKWLLTRNHQA